MEEQDDAPKPQPVGTIEVPTRPGRVNPRLVVVAAVVLLAVGLGAFGLFVLPRDAGPTGLRAPAVPTPQAPPALDAEAPCPAEDPADFPYSLCLAPQTEGLIRARGGSRKLDFTGRVVEVKENARIGRCSSELALSRGRRRAPRSQGETTTAAKITLRSEQGALLDVVLRWPRPLELPRFGETIHVLGELFYAVGGGDSVRLSAVGERVRVGASIGRSVVPAELAGFTMEDDGARCALDLDCVTLSSRRVRVRLPGEDQPRSVPRPRSLEAAGYGVRVFDATKLTEDKHRCRDHGQGGHHVVVWRATED
jgi:hypothetical protein